MTKDTVRWGILGAGRIAGEFAEGLKQLPDARLAAVGSRTQEKAVRFGDRFSVPPCHASYEALAADPDVDIIYVATPHSLHKENTILCLEHGKAVLCEKPFTINASEAREAIRVARERGLFLMEAMWSRFFPLMGRLREILREGVIGELKMLQADFGFRSGVNPESRLYDLALGGGALLDVGVYPVSLASMLLGRPDRVLGLTHLGTTGVDELSGMLFSYSAGQIALLATSIRANTVQEAVLTGAEGWIRVHSPWWKARSMTVRTGGKSEEIEAPYEGNGYQFEAAEAMECLRQGSTESAIMPLHETISVMETLDSLRQQWGLRYPMEQ